MKTINVAFLLCFFLSSTSLQAKEFCSARLIVDPSVTSYVSQGHLVVEVSPLDSVDFWVTFETDTDFYYQCVCAPNNPWIRLDTVFTFGLPFHITEVGSYHASANSVVLSGNCDPRIGSILIEVIYSTSSNVPDATEKNETFLYPTTSSGIYSLKSKNRITTIHITDYSGRLVLMSDGPSVIDLSSFSSGIYIYAITQENGNIFRGRIVKE